MKKTMLFILCLIILHIGCKRDLDLLQVVLSPPSKVELVFPENNSECTAGIIISQTESEVVFDWSDANFGDGYIVHLTNLSTNQEQVFESESSSLPIIMQRGTPYQWYVETFLIDSNQVTSSNVESFYNAGPGIQSFIPFPASAVFPRNGELVDSSMGTITMEWESSDLDEDVVEYDLYFDVNQDPVLFSQGLQTNSTNIDIDSDEIYFWKVITRDARGNESSSRVFSFETTPN